MDDDLSVSIKVFKMHIISFDPAILIVTIYSKKVIKTILILAMKWWL